MVSIEQAMAGKVAVITGGNTGIGKGCAEAFCSAGMKIVIAARRENLGVEAAEELSQKTDSICVFHRCDISDEQQMRQLVEFAVEKFGGLDVMVNNAGYVPPHLDTCDMPSESYLGVLKTNLCGTFYGCKYAIPHLRKSHGAIVNMSSILAQLGQEQTAGYSSTKGGIRSLTQTLAIEEARYGVRVNCILPGHIVTDLFLKEKERVADPEAYADRCNHYSWLGRGGTPLEVGQTALFLASPWAGYITGASILVTGGMELGTIPKYYAFDTSREKMKNA